MQRLTRACLHRAWWARQAPWQGSVLQQRGVHEDRDGSEMEELLERTLARARCCAVALRVSCLPPPLG